ncbi:BRO-N domain-containing protein [Proteus faecis]|uniref:BRO-N domain-containing protein n=1 Tax=Proteus faecis TaxID=2050967 RepID=UPI000D68E5FD|nr:BRO family protein [Proteus faecis]
MNSITKNELTFQNFTFNPIVENGQVWLTSTEIAQVLGYSRTDNVSKLYSRNSDEFTDSMTMTVNMTFNGINNSLRNKVVRVYSLRGAHLIAMFASTPVAKEFRKWVLDILDREVADKKDLLVEKDSSVSANGLLARLSLICTTWDEARKDIENFDPKMAKRLNSTMSMFLMYSQHMKGIAKAKQVRRLTH